MGYTPGKLLEEVAHEYRKNGAVSVDGFLTRNGVPRLCTEVQRQPSYKVFLMLGPVSMHGLCATILSREPAGYRMLPPSDAKQALPYGYTGQDLPQYTGGCE